jgi:hypothetical protein
MSKDYGLRVSQRGYDVKTAPDFKQLFSSSWPAFTILEEGSFSVTPGQTIVSHNLGYVPAFLLFHDATTGFALGGANQAHGLDGFNASGIGMSDTNLIYSSLASGTINGHYFIFQHDLEQSKTFPNVVTGTISDNPDSVDKDYGFKVSKDGFDVYDTDLRHFAMHTKARSPMVDTITYGTKSAGGSAIVVTHDLGYEPFPLVYAKLVSGAFSPARWQPLTAASDSAVIATSTTVSITIPYACDYCIIVLKDPMQRS